MPCLAVSAVQPSYLGIELLSPGSASLDPCLNSGLIGAGYRQTGPILASL